MDLGIIETPESLSFLSGSATVCPVGTQEYKSNDIHAD
jgi:hypothetical protein